LVESLPSFNGYRLIKLPLLGLFNPGTILKRREHRVTVHFENLHSVFNPKSGRPNPAFQKSDIVGFSAMTSTANHTDQITQAVHRTKPGTRLF
jgi:hypothetical protein